MVWNKYFICCAPTTGIGITVLAIVLLASGVVGTTIAIGTNETILVNGEDTSTLIVNTSSVGNYAIGGLPNNTTITNYSGVMSADNVANNSENNSIDLTTVDSDGDGISDYDEINGFTWYNITYYTDPLQKSTDFDPYNDYKEITTINMDPTVLSPGRHPLVPSYPDLKVEIGKIAVNTLTKITSTETKENYSIWDINTETVDVTKVNWGANTEAKVGWSWSQGFYAEGKAYAYYDSLHLLTATTISTTSGWNKEEWSMATAVDTDKAARLKYYLKIKNNGTDTAKNVQLKFNVKIGNKIITTITTDKVANRIDPNTVYPTDTFFVIEKDNFGNDITVTLNELKSIELGAPLTIEILEIYAEVPWENEQYRDWSDYKAGIDRTSARIVLDTGNGVKEYRVFSGIRYPASGNPYYFMNVTLENATLYTLGGEQKEDGIYIGGEKVEDWRFGFDNSTFSEVVKHLNETNGSLLTIPIRQGWTILMKPPDKEPPKMHWAVYTRDLKGIVASVSDNEKVGNVIAYVKVGSTYQNVTLEDNDNDLIYNATFPEKITDLYDGFVNATDGKLYSTLRISSIPDVIVDIDAEDDPINHTWNTIQEGIDNANESDIVYVRNGTYRENVAIYKSITLLGEDNNNTIIDGGNNGNVVYLNANNTQISGFKIINGRGRVEYPTWEFEIRGEVYDTTTSHYPNATGCVGSTCNASWNANNFAGFWYHLKDGIQSENLTITTLGANQIAAGKLLYNATVKAVQFKVNSEKGRNIENGLNSALVKDQVIGSDGQNNVTGGGYYAKIGWQAEEYVALNGKANKLAKIVYEQIETDKKTLTIGDVWDIGDGYTLSAQSIDTSSSQAWLALSKDGVKLDDKIIVQGQAYTYTKASLASETDVPIFVTYVDSVSPDIVQLKYTWVVSTSVTEIKTGDKYGAMEVMDDGASDHTINLMNKEWAVSLSQNSVVDIMGRMKFRVADSSALRFMPVVFRQSPGIYEIRGKVARGTQAQTWNAYSFSGFYYDLDQDIKTEQLNISGISGRMIESGNLTYQTYDTPKYFEVYKNKGILVGGKTSYFVSGWKGEKRDALNGKANKLTKIVYEQTATDKRTLTIGNVWDMGDGYSLFVETINVSASPRWVRLVLSKDGNILANKTVFQGDSYQYSANLANETNVPIFITYLDSVFAGATSNIVQFKYTWLISQDVNEIKSGDEFGKLKVVSSTQDMVVLKNNYNFSLSQGSIINVIGDIKFKVADSAELRYYPAEIKTISWEASGEASGVKLDESENNVISYNNILNSTIGVCLNSANNNQLAKNNISSDYTSVYLINSIHNLLIKNNISSDYTSVYLINSIHNLLINNTLLSGGYGINYWGYDRIHFNNSIDTSNELNGKPVYYYFNKSNITLDGIDTNHLTIAYSTGFNIRNISVGRDGINLYYSKSNTISNNTFGSDTDPYNETLSLDYMSYNGSSAGKAEGFIEPSNKQYVERPLLQATVIVPVPVPVSGGGGGGSGGKGISLHYSNYNNIASNNLLSIILGNSHSNIVTNNNASINLYNSNNNVIDNNNASNKSGIGLYSSSNNTLRGNNANANNYYGIYHYGIYLYSSNNNTLSTNNALNNSNGIGLDFSNNNTLRGNHANTNNYYGIYLYSSNNNTLNTNNALNNSNGIYLSSSSNNDINNNHFNNRNNAYDSGNNTWNITKKLGTNIVGGSYLGGNYWSDYAGNDTDGDGLGDTLLPYNSNGGITYGGDMHPLVHEEEAEPPRIYIKPDYQISAVESNFKIDIMVDPKGREVFGAEYTLHFDTSKLEALDQTRGPFLMQDGNSSYVIVNKINNSAGFIEYGETRTGTLTGVKEAGVLSTIEFHVKTTASEGNTTLNLSDVILSDPIPALIPGVIDQDGIVNISTNERPVADCGSDKLRCENVGSQVQFDGSASYDPDGIIMKYEWDFGDGGTGTGVAAKHNYATYKWNDSSYLPFMANLTVTDNTGAINMTSQKVVIWMAGDANGEGNVNIIDAAIVGLKWHSTDPCADLNNDGEVNIIDASIIGLNWGKKPSVE